MNASYDIAQLRALYDAPHHHPGDPAKERARDPRCQSKCGLPSETRNCQLAHKAKIPYSVSPVNKLCESLTWPKQIGFLQQIKGANPALSKT